MALSEKKSLKLTNDAKEVKEAQSLIFDEENDGLFLFPGDSTHEGGCLPELRYIEMVYIDLVRYFSTRPDVVNVNDQAFLQMVLKSAAVHPPLGRVERFALNRYNKLGYETVMRVFGLRCLAFLHCSGDQTAFERVPIYVTPASDGSIPVAFKPMNVYFITGTKCKCVIYNSNQERFYTRPNAVTTATSKTAMPLPLPPHPPPHPPLLRNPSSLSCGTLSQSGEQKSMAFRLGAPSVKQQASLVERKNPLSVVDLCRSRRRASTIAGPHSENRSQVKCSTSKLNTNTLG